MKNIVTENRILKSFTFGFRRVVYAKAINYIASIGFVEFRVIRFNKTVRVANKREIGLVSTNGQLRLLPI